MTFLLFSKVVFGSCKSISGKYSIFQKCYFPKRKMFSCVGLHFQKFFKKYFLVFGKEEGKDKPRKTWTKPRLTLDWVRPCDTSRAPLRRPRHQSWSREAPRHFARSRSARRRDRNRRRDLTKRWSQSREAMRRSRSARRWDRDRRREIAIDGARAYERSELELGACNRRWCVRASPFRSLSLSLSLSGIHLKWK